MTVFRLALDENFDQRLIEGLLQHFPDLDWKRIQEAGLSGAPDETILEWAAGEGRILLTHDVKTVPPIAHARVAAGLRMPGVFAVRWTAPLRPVIENLRLLGGAGEQVDWEGQVWYLPF